MRLAERLDLVAERARGLLPYLVSTPQLPAAKGPLGSGTPLEAGRVVERTKTGVGAVAADEETARVDAGHPRAGRKSSDASAPTAASLLGILVTKFCGGSLELAVHYATCSECSVYGVAVDTECEVGERLADETHKRDAA